MSTAEDFARVEQALQARGLTGGTPAFTSEVDQERPWFVQALTSVSGWLAGLLGLGFLVMVFRPDSTVGFTLLGVLCLTAAFSLYRLGTGGFLDQLALALALAGHVALTGALGEATDSAGVTALGTAVLQVGWLLVVPSRAGRVLSGFFAAVAWALAVRFMFWEENVFRAAHHETRLGAALVGWALSWGPVLGAVWWLVAQEARWMAEGWARHGRSALSGLLLALTMGTVVSQPMEGLLFWESSSGEHTNWLALWPLLSAAAALFALGVAHAVRSRPYMGLAIAAALLNVVHFYFLLGTTLLLKAGIMLAVGVALLSGSALLGEKGRAA